MCIVRSDDGCQDGCQDRLGWIMFITSWIWLHWTPFGNVHCSGKRKVCKKGGKQPFPHFDHTYCSGMGGGKEKMKKGEGGGWDMKEKIPPKD